MDASGWEVCRQAIIKSASPRNRNAFRASWSSTRVIAPYSRFCSGRNVAESLWRLLIRAVEWDLLAAFQAELPVELWVGFWAELLEASAFLRGCQLLLRQWPWI